jgi:nucleoside-diphosphate-sugar epimerase
LAVTGATGFIGSHLVRFLAAAGHDVLPVKRSDLERLEAVLPGTEVVFHLAALAHQRRAAADFEAINYHLPLRVAAAAATAGVRRMVFVSSISAQIGRHTPYGDTKARAELDLLATAPLGMVVVRPPMVYGPGMKGNPAMLLRLSRLPLPLPLATATALRSVAYVGNVADGLAFLAGAPGVDGETFTLTDATTISPAAIITEFRRGLGRSAALFPLAALPSLLRGIGAHRIADRLFAPMLFDGGRLREAGWTPPFETVAALQTTAREHRAGAA